MSERQHKQLSRQSNKKPHEMNQRKGKSYAKRVADVNAIYDMYVRTGLSNREIWRRYVYPKYGCTEATFYNLLKASSRPDIASPRQLSAEGFLFPELMLSEDELRTPSYYKNTDRK